MKRDGVDDDDDILSLLLRGFRPKYGIRIFKIWGPSNNVVPGGSRNPERCYDAKKGTNKLDRGKASISHICPWFYALPRHFLWFPAQNKMLSNIGSHGETIVHCPSEPTIAPSSVRPQGGGCCCVLFVSISEPDTWSQSFQAPSHPCFIHLLFSPLPSMPACPVWIMILE